MAEWKNAIITNKGMALLAKLVSGDVLSMARAVSGIGYVAPDTLASQTGVTAEKQELVFATQSYPEEGKCALPVKLTNSGVTEAYTANQIGVYAFDPDEGDILFLISQAEEGKGTYVPAEIEIPGFSASWEFFIQYGQADGVEVTVDPSNTVNHAEAEAIVDTHDKSKNPHDGVLAKASDLSAHTSDQNNPHNVTAEQLGLDRVSNTPDSEKYVKYASTSGTADNVKYSIIVRFNGGRTEGTDMFTFDGSTSKSVNITADKIGAAEKNHTHTPASIGAAAASHTHSYNDLTNKPTIPTIPASLPANGGNADTVDGKHASDFATSGHTHTASGVGAVPATGGTITGNLTFNGGNIILKENINYGTTLPTAGTKGRLFFKVVG